MAWESVGMTSNKIPKEVTYIELTQEVKKHCNINMAFVYNSFFKRLSHQLLGHHRAWKIAQKKNCQSKLEEMAEGGEGGWWWWSA